MKIYAASINFWPLVFTCDFFNGITSNLNLSYNTIDNDQGTAPQTLSITLYLASISLPRSTKQYIFTKYIIFGITSASLGIYFSNSYIIGSTTPDSMSPSIKFGTYFMISPTKTK